jgi:hypothetical protein
MITFFYTYAKNVYHKTKVKNNVLPISKKEWNLNICVQQLHENILPENVAPNMAALGLGQDRGDYLSPMKAAAGPQFSCVCL